MYDNENLMKTEIYQVPIIIVQFCGTLACILLYPLIQHVASSAPTKINLFYSLFLSNVPRKFVNIFHQVISPSSLSPYLQSIKLNKLFL